MKLYKIVVSIFFLLGTISFVQAQEQGLIGKYYNREVVSNQEGDLKSDRYLEIKKGSIATLNSKSQKEQVQQRQGSWNWDEKKKQLSAKFSANKKDETEFTYVFKKTGKNIELIKILIAEGEGEIYGKLWKKL